jgi:hypothetical protein
MNHLLPMQTYSDDDGVTFVLVFYFDRTESSSRPTIPRMKMTMVSRWSIPFGRLLSQRTIPSSSLLDHYLPNESVDSARMPVFRLIK